MPRCSWCGEERRRASHRRPVDGCVAKGGQTCNRVTAKCGNCRAPHFAQAAQASVCPRKREARQAARGRRSPPPNAGSGVLPRMTRPRALWHRLRARWGWKGSAGRRWRRPRGWRGSGPWRGTDRMPLFLCLFFCYLFFWREGEGDWDATLGRQGTPGCWGVTAVGDRTRLYLEKPTTATIALRAACSGMENKRKHARPIYILVQLSILRKGNHKRTSSRVLDPRQSHPSLLCAGQSSRSILCTRLSLDPRQYKHPSLFARYTIRNAGLEP